MRAWLTLLPVALLLGCGAERELYPVPFRATEDYFEVFDGQRYRATFVKGMNLGVGVPGTRPGELAISTDQYLRWFERMRQLGINALRVYTLHHPRFYEALFEHNNFHPDQPFYVLQGIWLDEDNPTGGFDLHDFTHDFDEAGKEVVDCVHGNRVIPERKGRAHGTYRVDVSPWVMAWISGREIFPPEVSETDERHKERDAYLGTALRLPKGTPTELWAAERMDRVVVYERERYGTQRPIGWSSWPTLDPLRHPTENHFKSGEDSTGVDLANLQLADAPGGFFVSYHAYPYYPNFVSEDLNYRRARDALGPNSYVGYLTDLKRHYGRVPVVIGEYGVPSSWGNAHYGHNGANHGGHDEVEQGKHDTRLIHNLYDTGCAGGMIFVWFDEWWKRTWIVDEIAFPRERYPIWHNLTSPEQNYGMIAWQLPAPDFSRLPETRGEGRIRRIRAAADAELFQVEVELASPLGAGEVLTVGYDTYADALGESVLPAGTKSPRRVEFALVHTAPSTALLYVTQAYDTVGIWHHESEPTQRYQSTATDGGPWALVRWMNDGEHVNDDGSLFFPSSYQDVGKLRVRSAGTRGTSLDAVIVDGSRLHLRLPWTLLQFTDPSSLTVLHDDRATKGRESQVSEGIAVVVALGSEVLASPRLRWPAWNDAPPTVEREKPTMEIVGAALRGLPSAPPRP